MNAFHPLRAPRRRLVQRGFTLIELMITVAIVAILARVAVPSYLEYVKRGKMTEAFNTLSAFQLTLGQWYQDNRTYVGICAANTMAAKPADTTNFQYSCTPPAATQTTYTITATGVNSLAGFVFTIDQSGLRASTATAATGWPSSPSGTSCWISSKSGSCY